MEEPEIATVGTKGQVVIPQQIRKELGIRPKTKLAMYSRGGRLVAAKVEAPSLGGELKALFREIDERYKGKKRPTEREILAEIQAYRKEKRAAQGA
ncbi:MAG: AbrB/MazE/SpoVT family DNA-binding domain-containing protein [Nitrososphaerota archaeon]|nr:AbrB/MazE/SpoVT family DNA-binding domain-containing protein [Nitrososphaerota archaeon]